MRNRCPPLLLAGAFLFLACGDESADGSDADNVGDAGDVAAVEADAPWGEAYVCQPQCDGLICGPDMCGGSCGKCAADEVCYKTHCDKNPCVAGYVPVKAGEFDMGSPVTEPGRRSDEKVHHVVISKPFCVKATEVTTDEWYAVMGNDPSYFYECTVACPVEFVNWWDSLAFCNALSTKEGLQACYTLSGCTGTAGSRQFDCKGASFAGLGCTGYRLPTEAEWEYVARAGSAGSTYYGTMDAGHMHCEEPAPQLDLIAWYGGNSCQAGPDDDCTGKSSVCITHSVANRQANDWALYDVLGNVWEWVWDEYGDYPAGPVTDPTGPATAASDKSHRCMRGGSMVEPAENTRAAYRFDREPRFLHYDVGFRPVRPMP